MNASDFPRAKRLPEEWLELIGFRLLERLLFDGHASFRRGGSFLKFTIKPVARGADTAIRIVLLR